MASSTKTSPSTPNSSQISGRKYCSDREFPEFFVKHCRELHSHSPSLGHSLFRRMSKCVFVNRFVKNKQREVAVFSTKESLFVSVYESMYGGPKLELKIHDYSTEILKDLSQGMLSNPSLKELKVIFSTGNKSEDLLDVLRKEFMQTIVTLTSLESLTIHHIAEGRLNISFHDLGAFLRIPQLRKISMKKVSVSGDFMNFLLSLELETQLEQFNINSLEITPDQEIHLADKLVKKFENVGFSKAIFSTIEGDDVHKMGFLANYLLFRRFDLERMRITGNGYNSNAYASDIAQGLKENISLKKLYFEDINSQLAITQLISNSLEGIKYSIL